MSGMRALIVSLALAAAAVPAAAQDPNAAALQSQLLQMQTEQQLARMREVATANQMMALEAQLRTEQAVRQMEAARRPAALPTLPYPEAALGRGAGVDVSKLPSVPEAALADSNRRVQEILKNSR